MKLHLGCGKQYIPGFVHVDVIKFPHVDIVTSVDDLNMVHSDSVDIIYACHILEHFNKKRVLAVLIEWKRVLKEGGILRLSVPDFETCVKLYLEKKAKLDEIHGPLMGGQTYLYNFHYSLFDYPTLESVLIMAGFSRQKIRLWDWRKTEHTGVDDYSQAYLPHMNKESGTLISLNVEAEK